MALMAADLMEMGRVGIGPGGLYMHGWWSADLSDLNGTLTQGGSALSAVAAWDLSTDQSASWYLRLGADWGTQWPTAATEVHGEFSGDAIDDSTTELLDLAIDPVGGKGNIAAIRNDWAANIAESDLYRFDAATTS